MISPGQLKKAINDLRPMVPEGLTAEEIRGWLNGYIYLKDAVFQLIDFMDETNNKDWER